MLLKFLKCIGSRLCKFMEQISQQSDTNNLVYMVHNQSLLEHRIEAYMFQPGKR
jgi:hypothetical protein